MKIAQIADIIERVPPKKYGGTERVVYALTEGLVKKGHDVTLFATADSITSAKLVSAYPKALREAKIKDLYSPNYWRLLNVGLAYQLQGEFDIIHDHNGFLSLPTANVSQTPVVMTLHGAFDDSNRKIFSALNNPYFVTISDAQALSSTNLNYVGTVYNGLDMDDYPFSSDPDNYLLFVGRISKEKGVHHAIDAALKLNLPLIIAAKLDEAQPDDMKYFKTYIKPKLRGKIRWVGEIEEGERNKLMSKALCFLHPVTWPEPFGLTLIESMACGTPVVAFNQGSIPEIVAHGLTGFVVRNVKEMVAAVKNIDSIDRAVCRSYALENFNAERMVAGYEAIYQMILQVEQLKKMGLGSSFKDIAVQSVLGEIGKKPTTYTISSIAKIKNKE